MAWRLTHRANRHTGRAWGREAVKEVICLDDGDALMAKGLAIAEEGTGLLIIVIAIGRFLAVTDSE